MNPIEKVPRCACRNLAARRNCWGSNTPTLWDETRSRRPLMKNLFLPLLIQFCNSDVSSHPMIHLSCVCRCRNSGVSCSTGTLFNPETCRWLKTIVSKSRSRERRDHFLGLESDGCILLSLTQSPPLLLRLHLGLLKMLISMILCFCF